ncbi:MAG: hypothetical protein RIM23_16560 [Coleofasciculus sp. G3-WIS-01]|uniref:ArnT family glycosyltransferase n=1 Tax=Coleofasciculus sp. G3-WIS-01 TaxID=3069528 RepID=UPI0032F63038
MNGIINMLAGLPLLSLLLLFLIFQSPGQDWRGSVLSAAIVWGVLITVLTETLSLFRVLTFSSVLVLWLITDIALLFIYYRLVKRGKRSLNFPERPKLTPVSLVLLGGIVCIVATVGLIAVVAPPNNWDSMTYHLARVVHWIQNRSVAHYPTYYSAQLVHPPFAEFVIMHLRILSRGDRLANLVQWLSMIGSIIGVSLIAKQLGADQRGQIFAAIFCATIPMGILQASSTQNDYAVAFWLVCIAHSILLALPEKKIPLPLVLSIGASLGLAVFTKSSGYIYAFPLMVWFFLAKLNRLRWKLWKPISIVTLIFLSLNWGHYSRNFDLYGNPISVAEYSADYKIEVYSLPTWISNIIRNLSLHVDIIRYLGLQDFITPTTGISHKLISIIHSVLGVNMNDPRTTYPLKSYTVPGLSFDENVAGNPLHLFLIALAIIVFVFNKELRTKKDVIGYVLALICGFLLLCWMLKIQPYQSRHHLSIFVLFSSFVGLVFNKSWNCHVLMILAVIMIVASIPFMVNNKYRPIAAEQNIFNTSRNELYFTNRKHLKEPYFATVDFLKKQNCETIGLSLGGTPIPSGTYWEYPFWVLLQENNPQTIRFEHILHPDNRSQAKSKIYPHNNFNPCAIIAVRGSKEEPVKEMVVQSSNYVSAWSANSDQINVLIKERVEVK